MHRRGDKGILRAILEVKGISVSYSQAEMKEIIENMLAHVRHCNVLGIQFQHAEQGKLCLMLPYSPAIIGNPSPTKV